MTTQWYNDNWRYRQKLTITNNDTTLLSGYPVRVVFDHAALVSGGKSRTDGADVIITDSSGRHQLAHWIESGENTSTCTLWVRISYMPASESDDFYMYYGNNGASDSSNPSGIFSFYDGFDTDPADGYSWYIPSASYTVSGGEIRINSGGMAQGTITLTDGGYYLESRVKYLDISANYSGTLNACSSYFPLSGNANSDALVLFMRKTGTSTLGAWIANGASASYNVVSGDTVGSTYLTPTYYVIGTRVRTSGVDLYVNYVSKKSYNFTWSKAISATAIGSFNNASTDIQDTVYDWIRIRKYVSSEPSTGFGAEEDVEDQPTQEYGLAISRPGYDVKTSEEKDLIYSTRYSSPQPIVALDVPARGKVPHDLDFAPAFYEDVERDYFGGVFVDDTFIYNGTDRDTFVYLFYLPLDGDGD